MKTLTITAVILVSVLLAFINERIHRRLCPRCGRFMHRHFDPEEDAYVYQCHRCGSTCLA